MELQDQLNKRILRTTDEYIKTLEEMGISTLENFLMYLPRAHEDLSQMHSIGSAPLDTKVTMRGNVENIRLVRTRRNKQLVTAKFTDTEGYAAEVIWFNQPHIKRMIQDEDEVVLTGKLVEKGRSIQMMSREFEKETGTKKETLRIAQD